VEVHVTIIQNSFSFYASGATIQANKTTYFQHTLGYCTECKYLLELHRLRHKNANINCSGCLLVI